MSAAKPTVATVAVHTEADGRSHFECPNCGRRIGFKNTYPLSFQWKVCPGCRWQWMPTGHNGIGPMARDLAEQTSMLEVASSGRSVDEPRSESPWEAFAGAIENRVEDEVERRVGRPEVGPMVNVRMPEDLIAWIDGQVEERGLSSRAELVRDVLAEYRQFIEAAAVAEREAKAKRQRRARR